MRKRNKKRREEEVVFFTKLEKKRNKPDTTGEFLFLQIWGSLFASSWLWPSNLFEKEKLRSESSTFAFNYLVACVMVHYI